MEQTKDYSLLRPFDLEAAKRGESILWIDSPVRWVALSAQASDACNIVEHAQGLSYVRDKELRMAPLCWIEGRPVYRGDKLYYRSGAGRFVAKRRHDEQDKVLGDSFFTDGSSFTDVGVFELCDLWFTWDDPSPVLCEVEGKPVRKGDRIWSNFFKRWFTVTGKVGAIKEVSLIDEQDCYTLASSCSWKRKVITRGFINIYARTPSPSAIAATGPCVYKTHEAATKQASKPRSYSHHPRRMDRRGGGMKPPRSFLRTLPDAALLIVALLAALVADQANDDAADAKINPAAERSK